MAENDLFKELEGEHLSSVTFVQDYFQLVFDGPGINVMNPTTVKSGNQVSKSWDEQFRNMLCSQITKIVKSVDIVDDESFTIIFEDSSTITVSLKPEDYTCPEAIDASGFRNNSWIVF